MIKITSQMLAYHLYFCILVGQITTTFICAGALWASIRYFKKMYDKVFKK